MVKGVWQGEAVDTTRLISCIEGANKRVDSKDKQFTDGWRIDLRVELDRQRVLERATQYICPHSVDRFSESDVLLNDMDEGEDYIKKP